jgi:tetratricopeptide (TPR) repeat protein
MSGSSSVPQEAPERLKAQKLYLHGLEALKRGNFDYAIELLQEACTLAPDQLMFRRALRAAARQKYGNQRPSKLSRTLGTLRARTALKAALARGQHHRALQLCEAILALDPWDIATLVQEAEVFDRLGYLDSAVWAAETAVEASPTDLAANRCLARLYEKRGEYSRAIACWERVKKLAPGDEEAERRIRDLAAVETISRGGYDGPSQLQDASSDQGTAAVASAAPPPISRWEEEAEKLRERIRRDPTVLAPYLELAKLLREHRRWDEALEVMSQAIPAAGPHPDAQAALADIEIDRLRYDLAAAERELARQPNDPQLAARVEELRRRLNDFELREYRRRCDQYPTDLGLRFELGVRLARAGLYDQAITELQQARQDPRHRVNVLLWLGHCFAARRLHRLAQRHYQEALELLQQSGARDDERVKELYYLLGRTYEEMQDLPQALRCYEEVAALDFAYRDVAQRLTRIQTELG